MRTDIAEPVRLKDYRVPDYLIDKVDLDVKLHPLGDAGSSPARNPPEPAGAPQCAACPRRRRSRRHGRSCSTTQELDLHEPEAWNGFVTPDQLTLNTPPQHPFVLCDRNRNRCGGQYAPDGSLPLRLRLLHPMRGGRLPPHHLFSRPSRCAECLYGAAGGGAVRGASPAFQRQQNRGRQNRRNVAPFRGLARSLSEALYLFALVGGDLGSIFDEFTTSSGRKVALGIHVEHGKEPYAAYAMDALKRAMAWDEKIYGREYDLDVFNIVAVSDFNMGAMENKGLNIFNDKYVLASPATATDTDYAKIEAVIAHEYFHNWTGNRITCRDWFQLCLKEGLTVFRDHAFSADMRSAPVRRIGDVRTLRAHQFAEDAGPLAHNVRPDTYFEINNFYTATIYEKGAEIIRMLKVLIGDDAFRKGMDLYFDRYDGTAATIEDFIACFAETSEARLDRIFALVSPIRHPARRGQPEAMTKRRKPSRSISRNPASPPPAKTRKSPSSFRSRLVSSFPATATSNCAPGPKMAQARTSFRAA